MELRIGKYCIGVYWCKGLPCFGYNKQVYYGVVYRTLKLGLLLLCFDKYTDNY